MRCLAVCHSELVIRLLHEVLPPRFDVGFLVESRPLARRLHDAGIDIAAGDIRQGSVALLAAVAGDGATAAVSAYRYLQTRG